MYSLLLMTAMAGSPDAASFGWRSSGCNGCFGGVAVGCSGYSSCYGCSGYLSCHGCNGFAGCSGYSCSGYSCSGYSSCHGCGGCSGRGIFGHGLLSRLRGHFASRHGCSGSSCHGCYGSSCYGSCHGGVFTSGWGSCYGTGYSTGCYGSCYGSGIGAGCYGSCYGGGLGGACYGASVGSVVIDPIPAAPVYGDPIAPVAPATPAPAPAPAAEGASTDAPAHLKVELPTSARLFVDGQLLTGTGENRKFHTPDLPQGETFFYDLRAEVEVNGTVQTEEKRVVVRSGETVATSFAKLAAAVSDARTVAAK